MEDVKANVYFPISISGCRLELFLVLKITNLIYYLLSVRKRQRVQARCSSLDCKWTWEIKIQNVSILAFFDQYHKDKYWGHFLI